MKIFITLFLAIMLLALYFQTGFLSTETVIAIIALIMLWTEEIGKLFCKKNKIPFDKL
jgi:hypothetical protein